jgi:hypothetical protein
MSKKMLGHLQTVGHLGPNITVDFHGSLPKERKIRAEPPRVVHGRSTRFFRLHSHSARRVEPHRGESGRVVLADFGTYLRRELTGAAFPHLYLALDYIRQFGFAKVNVLCIVAVESGGPTTWRMRCEAMESDQEQFAFTAFERLFQDRGLPQAILYRGIWPDLACRTRSTTWNPILFTKSIHQ